MSLSRRADRLAEENRELKGKLADLQEMLDKLKKQEYELTVELADARRAFTCDVV